MAKPELRDHRKFLKLKRLMSEPTPHLLGYLECLWLRGYQTGSSYIGDALDVEAAAEYPGEEGKLARALLLAGLIDQNEDGSFSIHDLYEHAPPYARKRMHRLGNAPEGVEWSSLTDDDSRKLSPRGRKVSPSGQQNGKTASARTTKPKTQNQEPRGKKTSLPKADPKPPEVEPAKPGSEVRGDPEPTPVVVVASAPEPPPAVAPPKPPRPRRPLFDAIAELSGCDPSTEGGLIGKIESKLANAEPPYTPDDVREFGRRFWEICTWAARDGRARPTPNEIGRWISGIRAPPPQQPPKPTLFSQTKRDADRAFTARMAADAYPNGFDTDEHEPNIPESPNPAIAGDV